MAQPVVGRSGRRLENSANDKGENKHEENKSIRNNNNNKHKNNCPPSRAAGRAHGPPTAPHWRHAARRPERASHWEHLGNQRSQFEFKRYFGAIARGCGRASMSHGSSCRRRRRPLWPLELAAAILLGATAASLCMALQTAEQAPGSSSQQQQPAAADTHFVFARSQADREPNFWLQSNRQALEQALQTEVSTRRAKSAVLFIGDGMSLTTITSARILQGQLSNRSGEEEQLAMDKLPHVALMKTYNLDQQVPDSAATATAILTGYKANFYTLGVNGNVRLNDTSCERIEANKLNSILKLAQEAGKSTGIVTNTRITHATPAAGYAHASNRRWECDAYVPRNLEPPCKDIARQLIEDEPGSRLNVILGGGRRCFFGQYNIDPGPTGHMGLRADGRNLINDWIERRKAQGEHNYAFVNSTENLRMVNVDQTDYLLGLFSYSHMSYEELRDPSPNGEPSLTEMTETAIKILSRNPNGYLLLVEGGRIDHAHHENVAGVALRETISLSWAVQAARNMIDSRDTLLAVTSDHAHALTMNGIAPRGNPILGLSRYKENATGLPYTTLIYGNGPGRTRVRANPDNSVNGSTSPYYVQYAAIHQEEAFHDGSDVAVFAAGPWAHLFQGVQEQSYIAHVLAHAMCLAPLAEHAATAPHCRAPNNNNNNNNMNQDLNELLYGPSSTSSAYLPAAGQQQQINQANGNAIGNAPARNVQLTRGGYNAYQVPPATAASAGASRNWPSAAHSGAWLLAAGPLVGLALGRALAGRR